MSNQAKIMKKASSVLLNQQWTINSAHELCAVKVNAKTGAKEWFKVGVVMGSTYTSKGQIGDLTDLPLLQAKTRVGNYWLQAKMLVQRCPTSKYLLENAGTIQQLSSKIDFSFEHSSHCFYLS